jgi:DNA repair exonuclease SbcCD ATPase subunit
MNNLLFTTLIIALLYYFFYYLPQKKSISPNSIKLTQTQFTQTEPDPKRTVEYEPGPSDTLNCPGAISFPSHQTITESEAMKKLEAEKTELQKDIQQKERTIIGLNNSYSKLETKTKQELDNLKEKLKDKDQKIKELSEVEKTIDNLTKSIQDLNKELN